MISQSTIEAVQLVSEKNHAIYLTELRKEQLLALFEKSDARGQDLLLAIAAINANCYPKE